ncbi:MAG: hypothetical protein ACTHK0_08690 [Ginsengibacter sp.]
MNPTKYFFPNGTDSTGSQDTSDASSPTQTNGSSNNNDTSSANTSTDDSTQQNSQTTGTGNTDSEGFKLLDSGTWNNSASLNYQGGQVMHFQVKNVNVLGTTLSINSNLGGNKSLIILPQQTGDIRFDCFGSEPMGWTFDISTDSDAFIVAWKLFSSWIPGDPANG